MRWLLLLLLIANLSMFGWWQGWYGGRDGQVPEEASPGRLRVVPIERLGVPTARTVPPSAQAPAGSASGGARSQGPEPGGANGPDLASVAQPPAVQVCREFTLPSEERARALRSALSESGARVDLQRGEPPTSFLVYLPPSGSAADAQRKVAELRRAGMEDAFLMQDGPLRLGVSVGVFSREEGARAMSARVAALGHEVRVAPRPPAAGSWRLTARWSDAASAARGASAAVSFGAESRDCPV